MKRILIALVCVFVLCALASSNILVLGTRLFSVAPSGWTAHPMIYMRQPFASSPSGLSPSQIRIAYNLPSTGGTGTIAIVDAFDDPTALNDLNVFSTQFGLPTPNFEKHVMSSGIPVDGGWALEMSLDIQWAHTIAPNAKILLVEATSNGDTDLLAAVDYARSRSDVIAVSMSWGGPEFSGEVSYDSYFTSSYGAAFFASSGDSGAGVSWPAVSANVIGVGGTTLTFSGGVVSSETAWSGSGGGVSAYVSEPSYQVTYGVPGANGKRAVPDVSYDANPNSGVSVYDSTPYSGSTGWWVVGGTSAGAPQWAAIQSLGLTASNNNFYQDAKSGSYSSYLRDITSGSNGYPAKVGYDLVTGLGSPLTTNFTPTITPDFSMSASPSALTIRRGNSGTSTITVSSLNGFSGTVSLTATALTGLTATLNPTSVTLASGRTATSTLTIKVASNSRTGTYTVTVKGTSGSLSHSVNVQVTVRR
jgi:subtilase family serine protease